VSFVLKTRKKPYTWKKNLLVNFLSVLKVSQDRFSKSRLSVRGLQDYFNLYLPYLETQIREYFCLDVKNVSDLSFLRMAFTKNKSFFT